MAKILVVDDSPSIQQLASFTLKSQQHQVDTANDGAQGLDKAKAQQYDMILTDMNMPNMNGVEMTQQIRQLENYQYTPIIMLTTESEASMKAQGKEAGVTGWIVKPFNPEGLIKVIGKVLVS